MEKNLFSVHLCVLFTLLNAEITQGQTWTNSNAPQGPHLNVACSADGGTILGSIRPESLVISTNGGQSWTQADFNDEYFYSVAVSANGSDLFACGKGNLFISTNSGASWSTNLITTYFCLGVACSANGTKVAATTGAGGDEPIILSTNSGATFTSNAVPDDGFASVVSSADGIKLAATYSSQFTHSSPGGPHTIYRSTDFGTTWTQTQGPMEDWSQLACSADGTTLGAVSESGFAISKDSGLTWMTNALPGLWSLACSADGTRLITGQGSYYGTTEGVILTSLDSGETWVTNNVPVSDWTGVAISADGSVLIASGPAGIYIAHTLAQPSLKICPVGPNLQLSWPLPSAGFVLQQSSQLNSTNWINVTNAVTASGYYNQVTISPPQTGNAYYRLANQQSSP